MSVQTPWPDEAPRLRKQHASLTRPPGYIPLVQGAIECEPRRLKDVDDARRRYERDGDRDRLAERGQSDLAISSAEERMRWDMEERRKRMAEAAARA